MDIQAELTRIRTESREDFKFTMIALDNVTRELGQVQARMARQEERFELMLDIVQRQLDHSVKRSELEDLRARVESLERRTHPAA